MSAHTANSNLSFQLPSMSYIDAKWEEPELRSAAAAPRVVRRTGLAAWLSRQLAAFVAWQRDNKAASELARLSDRELIDMGLSRSDIRRVFDPRFSADLQQRGSQI